MTRDAQRCYLVTGAAGFIAAKVCEFLLAEGHRVVGVDNLNDYYDVRLKDYRLSRLLGRVDAPLGPDARASIYAGAQGFLADASGLFRFRRLDIEDREALERLFAENRFDGVFNLAARAGVRYSMENPHVYMSTNAQGTLNLLEAQRKHGVKKHILASTSSLYADGPTPFTEEQPANAPISPYAASKKAAEMMAYTYHRLYGIDVTVLRYFTVYGPAGRPDMAPFRFIKWIMERAPIQIYGDGRHSRDFTYVDDIARGTIAAGRDVGFEIVNLGGGGPAISLLQLIRMMETASGSRAKLEMRSAFSTDARETLADISKAARLLSWRPTTSIATGLERTFAWHRTQAAWIAQLKL